MVRIHTWCMDRERPAGTAKDVIVQIIR